MRIGVTAMGARLLLCAAMLAIGCSADGNKSDGGGGGEAGGPGGASGGGPCAADSDCVFHTEAGCCGACLAKTDTVPATIACGANCGTPPSCLCLEGHCREGAQTSGAACDEARPQCGRNLGCCRLCSPVGAGCDSPRCTTLMNFNGLSICPQPA